MDSPPKPSMPTLEVVRGLTDEHVLRAIMASGPLTRADIAARTGISKPTVSESARRLSAGGLLAETGETTGGRGRAGALYSLASGVGVGVVLSVGPAGVRAEAIDPFGAAVAETVVPVADSPGSGSVADALREAARVVSADRRVRTTVVSVADPVDRHTGRLVQLPDAPFMVGELDVAEALAPLALGSVLVDNDVNWSARAEAGAVADRVRLTDFVYLYLDRGLGCAVVGGGEVARGAHGLVGEIAHVVTTGPRDRAMPLTEVFDRLGLRVDGTAAIDVELVLKRVEAGGQRGAALLARLATALVGMVSAVIALADPAVIVMGGRWGSHPQVIGALAGALDEAPRSVPVRGAVVVDSADFVGARAFALGELRALIASRSS